jgi:hypothetical protein
MLPLWFRKTEVFVYNDAETTRRHTLRDVRSRTGVLTLGYYAYKAASLPDAGAAQVEVNLPLGFTLTMTPAQVGDPEVVLEAYVTMELLALLPGATIETVA